MTVLPLLVAVVALLLALALWRRLQKLEGDVASLQDQVDDVLRICPHDEVRNIGTFGAPSYECARCGAIV